MADLEVPNVPTQSTVRLDGPTREAIGVYMAQNGMNFSQAIRMLVALALRDEKMSADEAFRSQAFREGVNLGVAAIKASLASAVDKALGDL